MNTCDLVKENAKLSTSGWPLAILRIGLGLMFLKAGLAKFPGMLNPGALGGVIQGWVNDMPAGWYPWYRQITETMVIPNADIFSYLVVFGEILVGLAFIGGLLVRPAAIGAILMNLNYHLASAYKGGASETINLVFILVSLVLLISAAGRYFGLDYFLRKKYPQVPLW